jgi:hypothetical protein
MNRLMVGVKIRGRALVDRIAWTIDSCGARVNAPAPALRRYFPVLFLYNSANRREEN